MYILNILFSAFSLDILDCNYLLSSEKLRFLEFDPIYSKQSIPRKIKAFFDRISGLRTKQNQAFIFPNDSTEVLFFVCTPNEWDVVEPLFEFIDDYKITGIPEVIKEQYSNLHLPFPLYQSHLLSVPFLPLVFYWYLVEANDGYQKETFYHGFHNYWTSYGMYIVSRLFVHSLSPQIAVIPNDHTMWSRVFQKACQDENVTTIYIQHASVSENFPTLNQDIAVLHGLAALEKYSSDRSKTRIFLTGTPKFDRYTSPKDTTSETNNLAICINRPDEYERVEDVCDILHTEFPDLEVTLRPHPRDVDSDQWQQLLREYNLNLSDPRDEQCFQMLQNMDVTIACETTSHLEASLMNVCPIYYPLSGTILDRYGYIENGLVDFCKNKTELIETLSSVLNNHPDVKKRARYFNITTRTSWEGHSSKLVYSIVQYALRNKFVSPQDRFPEQFEHKFSQHESPVFIPVEKD